MFKANQNFPVLPAAPAVPCTPEAYLQLSLHIKDEVCIFFFWMLKYVLQFQLNCRDECKFLGLFHQKTQNTENTDSRQENCLITIITFAILPNNAKNAETFKLG